MLIVVLVIIGLSILILGHEAGHFFVAKFFKLKVNEFGFGFPPRIFGVRRGKGETKKVVAEEVEIEVEKTTISDKEDVVATEAIIGEEEEVIVEAPTKKWRFFRGREPKEAAGDSTIYSLNWLPFGGFVKIAGENGGLGEEMQKFENLDEETKKHLFPFQTALVRSLVILAGVAINFLIGWFLVSLVLMIGTPPALVVSGIQPNSPALKAGIMAGDVIRDYVKADDFIGFVNNNRGKEIKFVISRDGKDLTFNVVPRVKTAEGEGALGLMLAEAGEQSKGFFGAVWEGLKRSLIISGMVFQTFYLLIKNLFLHGSLLQGVVGPVGVFSVAEQASRVGLIYFVQLLSLISLNLAVINLFPFPALDGGRFFMILIEKIKGSPISRRTEALINSAGFVFLIFLMIALTVRDVARWF